MTAATASRTRTVRSRDGTTIAWEQAGSGPPLILVDGALCCRAMGPLPDLGELLQRRFSVIMYDRRGRGESGDTPPYAVSREVEDIAALIAAAGGSAHLFGISSGAALAVEAAAQRLPVTRLAVYESPFIVDDSRAPVPSDFVQQLDEALADDRPGDAVKLFMQQVGMPGFLIALMRLLPVWSKLKSVAHTLPYDITIMSPNQSGRPLAKGLWVTAAMPTLVMCGGRSPAWMQHGARALADALPGAEHLVLPGQTHMVKAGVLAPALEEFFLRG
jgi:pimeloyl-ACP methyl ester carboxylesterase